MIVRTPWWKSRTLLSLLAISVLLGAWRWFVLHLYTLPPETIAAYADVTKWFGGFIAALALSLAGIKGVERIFSARAEALGTATTGAMHVVEKLTKRRELDVNEARARDEDYSERLDPEEK